MQCTAGNARLTDVENPPDLAALRDYRSAVAAGKVTLAELYFGHFRYRNTSVSDARHSYTLAHQTIGGIIWINIAYFIWEWVVRVRHAAQQRELRSYLLSGSGFVDGVSAIAIPAGDRWPASSRARRSCSASSGF